MCIQHANQLCLFDKECVHFVVIDSISRAVMLLMLIFFVTSFLIIISNPIIISNHILFHHVSFLNTYHFSSHYVSCFTLYHFSPHHVSCLTMYHFLTCIISPYHVSCLTMCLTCRPSITCDYLSLTIHCFVMSQLLYCLQSSYSAQIDVCVIDFLSIMWDNGYFMHNNCSVL